MPKDTKRAPIPQGDLEIVRDQWAAYARSRDSGYLDYVELAKKCDSYYRGGGDQWDKAVKAELDAQNRPAVESNLILSTINTILGEQVNRRADFKFKPRRDGVSETADALTKVVMEIADNNDLDWVEGDVFADGIIAERGYFDIRMDFSDNLQGEIKITAEDPIDILPDPDAKDYDPSTWKEVIKTRWLSIDDIESMYGKDKAETLKNLPTDYNGYGSDSIQFKDVTYGDTYAFGGDSPYSSEASNRAVRRVRVLDRQYRKLSKRKMFVDVTTGDIRPIPEDWSEEKVEQFATQFGLATMTKQVSRVRWTVSADNVLLHDDWSPYENFTVVPYFAYFRRGRPFGVVRNLLSPQDQLNKTISQELHVVNTTANSGWIVEQDSLANMDVSDLEAGGAKTGLVVEHRKGSQAPQKILPNQIPTGLDRISTKAAGFMREISGVSESLMGFDSAEVSGVAIQAKQTRGLIQMEVPFTHLDLTRKFLAQRMLELIQEFYTEERIIRVTNYEKAQRPEEEMVVNQMTAEGRLVNDLTLGEYDVVVSSMPARDTFDESQFAEALALRNAGVNIPDDAVIEYSHLSKKAELANRVREMMGMGEPTEEEVQMAQMVQQMELQRAQLELSDLEASVRKTMSEVSLNEAKAADLEDNDQAEAQALGAKLRAQMEELEQQIAIKREELDVRVKIAKMNLDAKTQDNKNKMFASKMQEKKEPKTKTK